MPVNPLQLSQLGGVSALGEGAFTPLAELGKVYKTSQIDNARRETLAEMAQAGAGADYGRATSRLLSIGDFDGAGKIAAIQKAVAPETSADMQAYGLARKQGYTGGIFDFLKDKAAAGATKVSANPIINTGEKEYDKVLGKQQAEEFVNIQKLGAAAPGAIANLNEMEKLTRDPNFYSGAGGELSTKFKRAGVGLGFLDADAAKANETFTKLSNKSVLDAAGGSLGTGFSNADRSFLQDANANISNTPEGNRYVIQLGRAVHQRNIDVANRAREYMKKNGGRIDSGFYQELSDWAEKTPLFTQKSGGGSGRLKFNPSTGAIE